MTVAHDIAQFRVLCPKKIKGGKRATQASPVVQSGIDDSAANGVVKGTDVGNPGIAAKQAVLMNLDRGRSVDGDIELFIGDDVESDDGACDGSPPPPLLMLIPTVPGQVAVLGYGLWSRFRR